MAQFNGFTCDDCGEVVSANERTKRTIKIDGPTISGEYTEDLCSNCISTPDGVDLKPLRRRGKHDVVTIPAPEPGRIEPVV